MMRTISDLAYTRKGRFPRDYISTFSSPAGEEKEILDTRTLINSSWVTRGDATMVVDNAADNPEPVEVSEKEVGFEEDHITCYLKEVAAYALLSPDEEIKLAKIIMSGEEALRDLIKENRNKTELLGKLWREISQSKRNISKFPGMRDKLVTLIVKTLRDAVEKEENPGIYSTLMGKAEEQIARIESAKHKIIQGNLRLVLNIAKQYRGRGMTFDDLIQEGNMGLIKAVGRYDFSKGYRFSTYATWWIRQSIIRSIYDKTRTIRLPVHFIEMKNLFFKVYYNLLKEYNREPTPHEIARRSKLPLDKVKMISSLSTRPISLETPVGDDGQKLADFLEDDSSDSPMDDCIKKELVEATQTVLASLHPREEKILRARFGMNGEKPRTLEQIGKDFKVSKERIRQIENKALNKLRHPTRREHLKSFMNK